VQARVHHSTLRSAVSADAAQEALFARVRGELEARDYQRPTRAQLVELGYVNASEPDSGTFGVDVSSFVDSAKFKCMKGKGYSFVVARAFEETCNVDSNGKKTVEEAWKGGLAHADIYLFPSYGCGKDAAKQVDETIDAMEKTPFGTLWLDIESGGQKDAAFNHKWLADALEQGKKRIGAKRMGVYSSKYEWGLVMGGEHGFPDYPLWFANYDGHADWADWSPFGGWEHPARKQFSGNDNMCGASVDLNWY